MSFFDIVITVSDRTMHIKMDLILFLNQDKKSATADAAE